MLLGERLIQKKLLNASDLQSALEEQKTTGEFIGIILLRRRLVSEEDLAKTLSEQFDIPFMKLHVSRIDWKVALRFSQRLPEHRCLVIRESTQGITLAITNPLDAEAVSLAEKEAAGQHVLPVLVLESEMTEALEEYRKQQSNRIQKRFDG